jgi:hypothetical protein
VLNDMLKRAMTAPKAGGPKFRVKPCKARLAPGVDPQRLNQLADELEDDEWIRR